jgi:hypothetical protein
VLFKRSGNCQRPWIAVLFLCLLSPSIARADIVTLIPSADTTLFESFPDNNSGANQNLLSGANGGLQSGRALLKFDLSAAIPSNAIIQSASLTVSLVILPTGGGANSTFDLRRVLADWNEGTGNGNAGTPAQSGDATWNARHYPSNLWTTPGGAVSNDFASTPSASLLIADLGNYTFASTSNLVADLQAWLQNPSSNFGWVLMTESETTAFTARRFGSRESVTNAPALQIQFATPPTIQWIQAQPGEIRLSFPVSAGLSYAVEVADVLGVTHWQTLTNLGLQNLTTNLVVSDPFPTNSQRFYRVEAH